MIELCTKISKSSTIGVESIKDIILIIGSLTTIFLALYGLNKWKKEHKGKLGYEFSRKLLKTIYTLRDQFKGVRSAFIHASEFPPEFNPKIKSDSNDYRYIFNNRLKPLDETYNELLSLLPEVEIEFDKDVRKSCDDILYQIIMYKMRLNEYIQLVNNTNNDEYYKEVNNIIFSSGKEDKTAKEFEAIITKAETEIKKRIKKY